MANTLTNLIPDLYEALDVVSRELTGFIPSVSMDNQAERAALDQTIRVPYTNSQTANDISPANIQPDDGEQTVGNITMSLDNSRYVPIRWQGEEQRGYRSNGTLPTTLQQQFAQAVRTLVNEIESDIAAEYLLASRAYGTAGDTPFESSLADAAQIRKILDDNGAPPDRSLVVNTSAGVNLRSLVTLNQANTAGTDELRSQGVLLPLFGMSLRESAQIQTHTAGDEASALCSATEPIGETEIAFDTGDGDDILAGDVVTIGSSGHKYLVVTGDGDATSGTITIAEPGLRVACADGDAITISSDYTANMGFSRNAIQLATRLPVRPEQGDMASDVEIITDPRTGMSFEVAYYPGFHEGVLHVGVVWGTKLIKTEHAALLLG